MNKFVMMLVVLFTTMFTSMAMAWSPPSPPASGGYVVDQAGKMSSSQIQKLNQKIERINRSTKNEFGVLLLPNMDGENIEDVANSTFKKWGVGKHGLDNGCLIVVSIKERKSRIETGKGVGGEVPDLQAHNILLNNLNPHLKSGDFYGGFDSTLDALASFIESRHNQKAEPMPVQTPTNNTSTEAPPNTTVTPRATPRASGGCAVATPGASEANSFWPMIGMFGVIGVGSWLVARSARRKKREVAEANLKEERARQARLAATRRRIEEDAFRQREREVALSLPTPSVAVPAIPPTPLKLSSFPPLVKRSVPAPKKVSTPPSTFTSAEVVAAAAYQATLRKQEADRAKEKARLEKAEEDKRERKRKEAKRHSSSSSSYSSSSSSDWGSSSSSSDSGSGFGGGDSGGGGSSSDW